MRCVLFARAVLASVPLNNMHCLPHEWGMVCTTPSMHGRKQAWWFFVHPNLVLALWVIFLHKLERVFKAENTTLIFTLLPLFFFNAMTYPMLIGHCYCFFFLFLFPNIFFLHLIMFRNISIVDYNRGSRYPAGTSGETCASRLSWTNAGREVKPSYGG